jgi:spore maturation protein CgeB
MSESLRLVVFGLSISSAWGNGHATTYRALVCGLSALGHRVTFLERDVPWYSANRDAPEPPGCRLELYRELSELGTRFAALVRDADAVIVGSYVPDGVDVLRFVKATARGSKFFYDIDTPVTLELLRRGEATYVAAENIPELDGYLSFAGGPALAYVERELGGRRALPLYCGVDAGIYVPAKTAPRYDLGYLGTYSADRQPLLEELLAANARRLPEGRFIVAGSSYPDCDWPRNVERLDHVSPADHPAFYGSLRYALNLTRADMRRSGYAPSVRIFEAAACGVPVISDVWPGIEEFFEPGREILLARDGEDVLEILKSLPEPERVAIGARARARVLREHTGLHRARTLERYVRELGARALPDARTARAG